MRAYLYYVCMLVFMSQCRIGELSICYNNAISLIKPDPNPNPNRDPKQLPGCSVAAICYNFSSPLFSVAR